MISGVIFSFQACNSDVDILSLPEYVAIQPTSFKFATVTVADDVVSYEFKITNFEPKSYAISKLSFDADLWITGSTVSKEVDISAE